MRVEVKMPSASQGMESGKIVNWLKREGDAVERGEPIVEIETDKATIEIEALAGGRVVEIVHAVGDEVPVGNTIAYIETGA